MSDPIDLDRAAHAALDALFDELLDLDPDQRAAWLDALHAYDPRSADALRRLLTAASARSPLDEAPWSRAPPADQDVVVALAAGTMIGAWRILALAGSGGMGTVYRAERADGAFTRTAALKLLNRNRAGLAAQFANERELLARLDHPHIAQLLDGGVDSDGTPWLAMRWIDGEDLPEWLATHRIGLTERVAMFADVVRAVAYAHQHLVVHRDIKPDNVRVDRDGRAILVDFGIARLMEAQAGRAPTLAMFTPEYAAPEQLVGGAVTTLTDVHALGVLFHEMLTGMHPFPSAQQSLAAAVQAICEQQPQRPSSIVGEHLPYAPRDLRGDLDAIVMRCLAKQPQSRYASAQALLDDLERHRRREPVLAHAPSAWYRATRLAQRHALPLGLAIAAAVALVAGLAGTAWQAGIARSERDSARLEAQRQHALREHLMLIFRECAAGAGNLTAKQMLDASAARLDVLYGNDPALRRSVLLALGELYFTMSDWVAARAVLERFLEQASEDTPPEDRALAGLQLALTLLRLGETDAAEATFASTPSLPDADPSSAVAVQRLAVQSALLRARGKLDEAIEIQRAEVALRGARVDETPLSLGVAQSNLGVALLQANRLYESRSTLLDALETWRAAGLDRNSNAITSLGNLANIEVLVGELAAADTHYAQARAFAEATQVESASSAALMANHARLLALLGRQHEAQATFERALELLARYSGERSPDYAGTQLGAAELDIDRGQLVSARQRAAAARSALLERLGANHALVARADALLARLAAIDGDAGAREAFASALERLGGAPPVVRRSAVRVRLWQAQFEHAQAHPVAAVASIDAALALATELDAPAWERAELLLWREKFSGIADAEAEAAREILVNALGADNPRVQALATRG